MHRTLPLTFAAVLGIVSRIGTTARFTDYPSSPGAVARGEKSEEAAMTVAAARKPLLGDGTRGCNKKAQSSLPATPARKRGGFRMALAVFLLSTLLPPDLSAREDSARLAFQTTAGPRKTRLYIVKKGEFITGIFRSQMGDEPVPVALIRQLNPGIKNLNRIFPGQRILLPVRETSDSAETSGAGAERDAASRTYNIREGDSISRIILTELNVDPEEVLPAYRILRKLNPDIADLNNLPAGQPLRLPPNLVRTDRPVAEPAQTAVIPQETPPAIEPVQTIEIPPPEPPPAESALRAPPFAERMLGIIRPVISRMGGTLTTQGNYFIPLRDNAQVTIDCSLIPVVELDDGSTVLLDFTSRLSENLKALINQSWTYYAFLPAEELGDDLASLQGIIRRSRNYSMSRVNTPLALTVKPEILVFPDWVIAAKKASGGKLYRQGLFILGANERPLPAGAAAFLEKNGLIVTEITEGSAAEPGGAAPAQVAIDLRGLKGIALAEGLLKAFEETPVRNAGIVIFDQARDGFNLSVTVDLLLQRGEKRYLIHTKRLPDQFIRVLKDQGTEVILLRENDPKRDLIENLLRHLDIPVSFGHFSFRIPEDGSRPRLIATFPALRATAGATSLYLVDFDISPDALSLLQGRLAGGVAKY
jgi:hypothetical protein